MRIGVRLSLEALANGEWESVLQQAIDLEKAGADLVWVPEAYGTDSVSIASAILAQTSTLLVGTGIVPIYTRTPALLAQTAATLDLIGHGRFLLGLGVSGPQVIEGWHGVAFDHPIERTRDVVEICRKVWRREFLTHDGYFKVPLVDDTTTGEGKPIRIFSRGHNREIPIYIAALGQRNVELAAELADGWLPGVLFDPENAGSLWGDALRRGLAKRSPDLTPLEIAAGGPLAIGENTTAANDEWMPWLTMHLGGYGSRKNNYYNAVLKRYGYVDEAKIIQDLYLAGDTAGAQSAIPADFNDRMSLVGAAGRVKERVAAYEEAGVTILNVLPMGPDRVASVERLRSLMN